MSRLRPLAPAGPSVLARSLSLLCVLAAGAAPGSASGAEPRAASPTNLGEGGVRTATVAACGTEPPAWAEEPGAPPLERGPCVVYCVGAAAESSISVRRSLAKNRAHAELARWHEARLEVALAHLSALDARTATVAEGSPNVCTTPHLRPPPIPDPHFHAGVDASGRVLAAASWRWDDFDAARRAAPGLEPEVERRVKVLAAALFPGCVRAKAE